MTHTETLQEIQNNAGNPERVYQLTKAALAQPAPVQELIYQMQMMDGKWIDQAKQSYEYNKAHGHIVRIVYTTPPAAPVPLTEPQRKAIYDAVQGLDVMKAILMTEAAHGITKGQP